MSNIPMQCALHNIQRTALALAQLGIASVKVTYEGCGDFGGLEDIEYFDAAGDAVKPASDNVTDTLKAIGHDFTTSSWQAAARDQECTGLLAMVTLTTLTAIEAAGHGGWEINQGSRGSFALRADATANLEHEAYIDACEAMVTEYNAATLAAPSPDLSEASRQLLENLKRLAEALVAGGATQAKLTYSGNSDSGGVDEIDVTNDDQPPEGDPGEVLMQLMQYDRINGELKEVMVEESMPFNDAMTAFWEQVLEDIARTGYDQAEGSWGELLVRADGTATSKHTDFYETTEPSSHRFGDWQGEPGPALAA